MQATFDNLPALVDRLSRQVGSLSSLVKESLQTEKPKLRTFSEFCEKVKVAPATGYRIAKQVPHIKRGKNLLFEDADIDAWLKSQKVYPVGASQPIDHLKTETSRP